MEPISYFLLGLPAAEARIACRKSFLMDAKSFRLGTSLSILFLAFSMRGLR
jgi:hypothetical protein